MDTMRERFEQVTSSLLDTRPDLAVVLAAIGASQFAAAIRRHPDRVINLGIREQLLIGVAGGLALAGLRPLAHTFAPFLVERPFEQIKLDLSHHEVSAVLVSAGGSVDYPGYGRTHLAPGDVALLDTLPGWTIHVPGHPDEAELLLRDAVAATGPVYLRLSLPANAASLTTRAHGFIELRTGRRGTVVAVGPMADAVLAATAGLDVTVLYAATVRPFDAATLRGTLSVPDVILVEPYLAGTSIRAATAAISDLPHRLLGLGIGRENQDLHRYGEPAEHLRAYGLDAAGLRASITAFLRAA